MSPLLWIIIVLLLVFGLKFKITIRWGQPQPAPAPEAENDEVEGRGELPVYEPRRDEDEKGERDMREEEGIVGQRGV